MKRTSSKIKRSFMGGYHKKTVNALLEQLEKQQRSQTEQLEKLRIELESQSNKVQSMEDRCRELETELLSKSLALQEAELSKEAIDRQYHAALEQSREYENYLRRVGQVYSAACESADGIVSRTAKQAGDLLGTIADVRDNAEQSAQASLNAMAQTRMKLEEMLPSITQTLERTMSEVRQFMDIAATIPVRYAQTHTTQQQAMEELQTQIRGFKQHMQLQREPDAPSPKLQENFHETAEPEETEEKSAELPGSLVEQAKRRLHQEMQIPSEMPTAQAETLPVPQNAEESESLHIPSENSMPSDTVSTAEKLPPLAEPDNASTTDDTSAASLDMPRALRRPANVKELLKKYSQP